MTVTDFHDAQYSTNREVKRMGRARDMMTTDEISASEEEWKMLRRAVEKRARRRNCILREFAHYTAQNIYGRRIYKSNGGKIAARAHLMLINSEMPPIAFKNDDRFVEALLLYGSLSLLTCSCICLLL